MTATPVKGPLPTIKFDVLLGDLDAFTIPERTPEPLIPAGAQLPVPAYSHDALIASLVSHPEWTDAQQANHFGRDVAWFHAVIASDSFQIALDPRRAEVFDPRISATLEERLRGLLLHSIAVLGKKLSDPKVDEMTVVKAIESGAKALGSVQKIQDRKDEANKDRKSLADRASALVLGLQQKRLGVVMDAETVEVRDD